MTNPLLDTLDNQRIAADIREYCSENRCDEPTTMAEAFRIWLEWNGIIGYDRAIRAALHDLIGSEHIMDMDRQESARLRELLQLDGGH